MPSGTATEPPRGGHRAVPEWAGTIGRIASIDIHSRRVLPACWTDLASPADSRNGCGVQYSPPQPRRGTLMPHTSTTPIATS
jgi:hypothetical protein